MCLQIMYLIYVTKQDLALSNQQWLICHKVQPHQTNAESCLSSSSCRAATTDILDPLSPLLPVIHRLWQVFRATSRILT